MYATKSYYLDLNRRMMGAPNGTMDYLVAESFEKLMSEDIERVYLGLSPFSNIQDIAFSTLTIYIGNASNSF
ncbi:MAG: phosphatidylglycerol lysyltransferase domain-containing protein [Candidatus Thermoplasmatota archaeon]|nr:phosphatidylglycerol lysyltransferase domain-containing protein [Candidatus Thermoplasmatota archaeon]